MPPLIPAHIHTSVPPGRSVSRFLRIAGLSLALYAINVACIYAVCILFFWIKVREHMHVPWCWPARAVYVVVGTRRDCVAAQFCLRHKCKVGNGTWVVT